MQVFTDIAGLAHAVAPGSGARVQFTFEGADLFEMEDQRQWLDGKPLSIALQLAQMLQREGKSDQPKTMDRPKCCHGAGSFKTYFRPLRQTPLPYPLAQGEKVTQSVSLVVKDKNVSITSPVVNETAQNVVVSFGGVIPGAAALPKIGVGVPPAHAAAMAKAMRASAGNDNGDD